LEVDDGLEGFLVPAGADVRKAFFNAVIVVLFGSRGDEDFSEGLERDGRHDDCLLKLIEI